MIQLISTKNQPVAVNNAIVLAIMALNKMMPSSEVIKLSISGNNITIITVNKESVKSMFRMYIYDAALGMIHFVSDCSYKEEFLDKFGSKVLD